MREPKNILEVDALMPDYLGLIFYPDSPRNMDKNPEVIPETNAKKVGVFVNAEMDTIVNRANEFKFTTVQLHGNESPTQCAQLMDLGYTVIKAIRVDEATHNTILNPYKNRVSAFLFDTKTAIPGGSGKKFDWELLERLASMHPFFLSGGLSLNESDAIKALTYENLIGVDLNSKFEIEPGLKDVDLLKEFILKLRS